MTTIVSNPVPTRFISKYLFLLVGQNPLPNLIAGLLLTPAAAPATIFLLHTSGQSKANTEPFAKQLKHIFCQLKPQLTVTLHDLHEADSIAINDKIKSILSNLEKTNPAFKDSPVGFNYTSGTKPMSIHTYHQLLAANFQHLTFSYLDARDLAVYIDGLSGYIPVSRAVEVSLEDLARLHGYDLTIAPTQKTPQRLGLAQALAQVHQTDDGFNQWRDWLGAANWQPPEVEDYELWRQWLEKRQRRLTDLPDPAQYPALSGVRAAMDALGNGQTTPEMLAAHLGGHQTLAQAAKWLTSTWLEEVTLAAVVEVAPDFAIRHYGMSLAPKPQQTQKEKREFDLDVAAMLGYQLMAISCIASQKTGGETKKHLLEVYVRARQLGGDEARIALVSCVKDPISLEDEIKREWHAADQIKVFGRQHLTSLATEFRRWFQIASRNS